MKIKCTLYSVLLFPSNGKKNTQKTNKKCEEKGWFVEEKNSTAHRPTKKSLFFEITDYITISEGVGWRRASSLFYIPFFESHRAVKVFLECIWKCHYFYYNRNDKNYERKQIFSRSSEWKENFCLSEGNAFQKDESGWDSR